MPKLVSFQWKKGPTIRKKCQLVRPCELALLSRVSFCNIPAVICKLDLVFVFDQIVDKQFREEKKNKELSSSWQRRTPTFATIATGEFSLWATGHLLYGMRKKINVIA